MNLLSQLRACVPAPKPKTAPKAPHPRLQNLLLGGPSQTPAAIERYRKAMQGRGWRTQRQIENSLGYATTVSTAFLKKLLDLGYVERRNKGGAEVFSRRIGFEWRWKV